MNKCHFIGIGGAGMAPLARLLLQRGCRISGSDLMENGKTAELRQLGAVICKGHAAANLPTDADTVVFSSAVTPDNPEYSAAAQRGLSLWRRGDLLAEYARNFRRVVAVSGSHGKSSITAMLTHILSQCGLRPGFLIGAARQDGGPASDNGANDDIFVTEADESDATHAKLSCFLGVVPNLDSDHAWSVGGAAQLHRNFQTFAFNSRNLLYCASPLTENLFSAHRHATILRLPEGVSCGKWQGFQAKNALTAVAAAEILGVPRDRALTALESFSGIARRVVTRYESDDLVVIEDYAHHPAEVRSCLDLLRHRYPNHHLRVLIQPHRYARLERYFADFTAVLKPADSLFIAPVFAAWTERGEVNSQTLAQTTGGVAVDSDWRSVATTITQAPSNHQPLLLVVLGAGDIEDIFAFLPKN